MLLRLIITEGPRKGEELVIRGDITLGRSKGDFALKDPKASGKHARIFANKEGVIVIEDLASSNGTYVNKKKIKKAPLNVGDVITIGKTVFEVRAESGQAATHLTEVGTWQEVVEGAFIEGLKILEENSPSTTPSYEAFRDTLKLEFTQGLQTGSSLTFGFGPRSVGKLCADGLLYDVKAPDLAFTLIPTDDALCELKTSVPDLTINAVALKTLLDKKWLFSQKLQNGDRISFGQTVIVIRAL